VPDPEEILSSVESHNPWDEKHAKLTEALATVMSSSNLVQFFPLDISDEESIGDLLLTIDNCIQYGEDLEPKTRDFEEPDDDDDDRDD
jgi:hypothetical protein